MTIKEKRDALENYCGMMQHCEGCAFEHLPVAQCDFMSENNCSAEWINEAYDLAFSRKPEHIPENDAVNHPSHYRRDEAMECIDEMILLYGKEAVMHFCLCNAHKYRYRAADKNGAEDLKKSDWYIRKYKELKGDAM